MDVALQAPRMRLHLLDAVSGLHPLDAAVRCLALACPELPDPAGLPLGQRDAALLTLRARLLGDRLVARTTCGGCGEQSTLELSVADLVARMSGPAEVSWTVEHRGRTLPVRALTSRDLAEAAFGPTADRALGLLVRAALDGAAASLEEEPGDELVDAVATSLAEHDPGAEVVLTGTCAACGQEWSHVLDPAGYVAAELAHQGTRLLAEVAELARAFGWSESDVLALSDQRRRAYLDLAAQMAG
jgi:hypothetical protein